MKIGWKEDKNRRALAIIRVSGRDQENNSSPEVQERKIVDYCTDSKLNLVKTFSFSESAKDWRRRKKYDEAIEYALSKNVKHVLFYMQDREARNMVNLEQNEHYVKNGRLVLHYVYDGKVFDITSPSSENLYRNIRGVINAQYSHDLGSKVSDALVNKAENGWCPCGRLPLGYFHLRPEKDGKQIRRAPTTIVVDPNARNVDQVKREFELRSLGYSLDKIRETIIRELYIPVGEERKYHRTEIDGRLKNPFYRGRFIWKGVEYTGNHPLIIPPHILDTVDKIEGRKSYSLKKNMEF